jgi:hypothetical protein
LIGLEMVYPKKKGKEDLIHRGLKDAIQGIGLDGMITIIRNADSSVPALAGAGDYLMQYGRPIDMQVGSLAAKQNLMQRRIAGMPHGGVAPTQMQVGSPSLPGMGKGVG